MLDETIQPVFSARPFSPTSVKSTPTNSTKTGTTKRTHAHFNNTISRLERHSPEPEASKRVSLDASYLSDSKPPRLKRVNSAHAHSTPSKSPGDSGYYDHNEVLSHSATSKQTKIAWAKHAPTGNSYATDTIDDTISLGFMISEAQDINENSISPGYSTIPAFQDPREYDAESLSVLSINFPPATTPTFGLPRAVVPPDSQVKRYYSLVDNAIADQMVAPLSKEWKKKTHDFLPKHLRDEYKDTLVLLDEVRVRSFCII